MAKLKLIPFAYIGEWNQNEFLVAFYIYKAVRFKSVDGEYPQNKNVIRGRKESIDGKEAVALLLIFRHATTSRSAHLDESRR